MNRTKRCVGMLLVAVMLFAGIAGNTAARAGAQFSNDDTGLYVSELTDFEIEVTGRDFEVYDTELQQYEHGDGEIVQISSTTAQVQIAFYDDSDTNLETLDLYNESFSGDVDDFEVLDEGGRRGTVYSFAVATYNDVQFYYYLSVTENVVGNVDLLQRIYSPDTAFLDDLQSAQDSILIDGDGFLEDVDARDLESLADLPSRAGDDDDVTPDATVDDEEDEDTDSRRGESTRSRPTSGETHDFELAEGQIVMTDEVMIGNVQLEEPVVEQVLLQLTSGDSAGAIQLMQLPVNAEGVLDSLLGSFSSGLGTFENLGTDADRTSAWSLDVGQIDGQESLIYIRVDQSRYDDVHYIELLIAPESTFIADMETFNDNVEIDGVPMYEDADIELLASLIEGGGQTAGGATGDDRERGNDGDKAGRNNRDVEEEDDARTRGLDLESQGLISDTEFESLQHGVTVEWDESAWEVDAEWELSAVSDPGTGVDTVILFRQEGGGSMMIQIMPSQGVGPADYLELWESDDYILDSVHEDAEILMSDSGRSSAAVVYLSYDDDGRDVILVQEVIDLDGGDTVAVVTMFASPDTVRDAYADAEDLVTVGEADAVGTFTPREIENAVTGGS